LHLSLSTELHTGGHEHYDVVQSSVRLIMMLKELSSKGT